MPNDDARQEAIDAEERASREEFMEYVMEIQFMEMVDNCRPEKPVEPEYDD